jgi:hypothetical protein
VPYPRSAVPAPIVDEVVQPDYDTLSGELGFEPAELIRARLINFLGNEGIALFDRSQAYAWLTEKREEDGDNRFWCWRPLRSKDAISEYGWNGEDGEWSDGFYTSTDEDYRWHCRPYDRLIPLEALQNVAKIEQAFGDSVKFFVSDYDSEKAHSFIMVRPSAEDPSYDAFEFIFGGWENPVIKG